MCCLGDPNLFFLFLNLNCGALRGRYDNKEFFFIIHFREKRLKQNLYITYLKHMFVSSFFFKLQRKWAEQKIDVLEGALWRASSSSFL